MNLILAPRPLVALAALLGIALSGCSRIPHGQVTPEAEIRKVASFERPARPSDLDTCIACHTGAMPGVKKISFAVDKEADFKTELLAEEKALYKSIEERIKAETPAPKHMPPGGQSDVTKVMEYLKGLIEST